MRQFFYALIVIIVATPALAEEKLRVVASFSILGDMVRQIGGGDIALTTLVGPDSDMHVYTPSPRDIEALAHAQVIVLNGLGFERWAEGAIKNSASSARVVMATSRIKPRINADGTPDPHAWQNLTNGVYYALAIRDGLIDADPAHAKDYQSRAVHFIKQMQLLDTKLRARFAKVPVEKRVILTTHDAFHYFANAYGLKVIAPLGMSTEAEPNAADLAQIIDQIRAQHITALFLENITDAKILRQIEKDTGIQAGGRLFSDALSGPLGVAPNYLSMFQANANAILSRLGK